MANKIHIPNECLGKFTRTEVRFIISQILKQVNLSCRNGGKTEIKLRGLGKIHTHGNTLSGKEKYQKKYTKKDWQKKKEKLAFTEKKLLF